MRIKYLLFLTILSFSCSSIKTIQNVAVDYYNIGNEYFNLKDYKKACEMYEKSLEYDKTSTKCIINLVISYQMNKEYAKAETTIVQYYKPDSSDFNKKLLILLGNNYYYMNESPRAIKTYTLYTESFPDDPQGYFNIALTYLKKGDKKNALEYFLKSYTKDNKFIPAVYNISKYYWLEKDYKNSLFFYKVLIDLDKSNPEAFFNIATLEYKMEDYDSAKEHFNEAIKLDGKNSTYYISLAKIYAKAYKDKVKTLANIESALKNGYENINSLQGEEEFAILKEYPEFKNLLEKYIKERKETQKQNENKKDNKSNQTNQENGMAEGKLETEKNTLNKSKGKTDTTIIKVDDPPPEDKETMMENGEESNTENEESADSSSEEQGSENE